MLGDNSPYISRIFVCLESCHSLPFCTELFFQGCLYSGEHLILDSICLPLERRQVCLLFSIIKKMSPSEGRSEKFAFTSHYKIFRFLTFKIPLMKCNLLHTQIDVTWSSKHCLVEWGPREPCSSEQKN